jgi:hypothetical protein
VEGWGHHDEHFVTEFSRQITFFPISLGSMVAGPGFFFFSHLPLARCTGATFSGLFSGVILNSEHPYWWLMG